MSPWKIEPGGKSEGGHDTWLLVNRANGGVWAEFTDRVAALACVRGYDAIGFVPDPKRSTP